MEVRYFDTTGASVLHQYYWPYIPSVTFYNGGFDKVLGIAHSDFLICIWRIKFKK